MCFSLYCYIVVILSVFFGYAGFRVGFGANAVFAAAAGAGSLADVKIHTFFHTPIHTYDNLSMFIISYSNRCVFIL